MASLHERRISSAHRLCRSLRKRREASCPSGAGAFRGYSSREFSRTRHQLALLNCPNCADSRAARARVGVPPPAGNAGA